MEENDQDIFRIDKHNLDEECEGQPLLARECSVLLAEAEDKEARAEAHLELVKAEVSIAIRNNPAKYVKNIPSRGMSNELVEQLVLLTPEYKKALKRWLAASHDVGIAKAGVTASEHKKRMIEKLVELQGRDYFASPKTGSGKISHSYLEADGTVPKAKRKTKNED